MVGIRLKIVFSIVKFTNLGYEDRSEAFRFINFCHRTLAIGLDLTLEFVDFLLVEEFCLLIKAGSMNWN